MHFLINIYGSLIFLLCSFFIKLIYRQPHASSFSSVKHSKMMKLSKISERVFEAVVSIVHTKTRQTHTAVIVFNDRKMMIRPFIFVDILMVSGRWEIYVKAVLDKEIKKGDVIVDIGAGIGIYVISFSDRAKKIIAFEPHPESSALLETNVRLNNLHNVVLIKRAVGGLNNSNVSFNLATDPAFSGISGSSHHGRIGRNITLETISLNQALSDESQIDWIIIDVEGFESEILNGGREILRRHSPKIIY